jgi:hypothetical protein
MPDQTEFRISTPEERKVEMEARAKAVIAEQTAEREESDELIEELASTTILYESFGRFIQFLDQSLAEVVDTSFEGNPVRTHVSLTRLQEEIVLAAHGLRDELIEKLAQYGDKITEKGGTLRTQVLNDDEAGVVTEEIAADIFAGANEEIPF